MRYYRIWFDDNLLPPFIVREALSEKEAVEKGIAYLDNANAPSDVCIDRVESVDNA